MALIELSCSDGHELDTIWVTPSHSPASRSIILLHEIFGLTDYIQALCEYWAKQGFNVLAPALFDRSEPSQVISYSAPDQGLKIVSELTLDGLLKDIGACVAFLNGQGGSIGVLGYCWGGGLAFRAACDLSIDAAACVYPTRLLQHSDLTPRCPVQFHFAERDKHASPEVRSAMLRSAPNAEHLLFAADHAFDRKAEQPAMDVSRDALKKFFSENLNA